MDARMAVPRAPGTGPLNKLLTFAGYFLSAAVPAALAFFSIPLMIQLLGLREFGRWALLEPLLMALPHVALLGVHYSLLKQISAGEVPAARAFAWCLRYSQAPMAAVAVGTWLVMRWLGYGAAEAAWFAGLIGVEAVLALLQYALRGVRASFAYSAATIVRAVAWFSVLGLAASGRGVVLHGAGDLFPWWVLASGLAVLAALALGRLAPGDAESAPASLPVEPRQRYRQGLRYGLPLLITAMLGIAATYGGRLVMGACADATVLASFVVYLKIGGVMYTLVIAPFALWWPAERFRRQSELAGEARFFRRVALALLMTLLLASGSLYLAAGRLLALFSKQVAFDPHVMGPLLLSLVFCGMAVPLTPGLTSEGRTHLTIVTSGLNALANMALCWVLLPRFGLVGAAWAAATAQFVAMVVSVAWSHRVLPVRFDHGKLLGLLAAAAALLLGLDAWRDGSLVRDVVAALAYTLLVAGAGCLLWPGEKRPREEPAIQPSLP